MTCWFMASRIVRHLESGHKPTQESGVVDFQNLELFDLYASTLVGGISNSTCSNELQGRSLWHYEVVEIREKWLHRR
jgi:hypothetical protein